ncbi:MAG: hypothetical protein DMD55_14965 [Gemmatimonadetes bacterium]|nr:MAG: hypothetical protein DMD55_14965 [Gemmatimonadota bacterium]
MRATTGGFLGLLAAALGGGTPCAAQGSLEFAGFGGLYAPSPGLLHLPGFSPGDSKGQLPQHTASVVGARVTAWVDRQIALELSLDHSGLQSSGAFGNKADFTTGSARLLVGIVPRTSPTSVAVALGLARVTRRGSAAYSAVDFSQASWGPTFGAVGRARLTPALALRAELDDYVYYFTWSYQHDFVFSLGLSITAFRESPMPP